MIFNTLLEVIKMQIKFHILKGGRTLTEKESNEQLANNKNQEQKTTSNDMLKLNTQAHTQTTNSQAHQHEIFI